MMSPAMIVAGCRRAMSTAAASRDRADASGGAQACSHARASGSARSTGSRSTPTLAMTGGKLIGGGATGPRISQARVRLASAGPYVPVPIRYW
jgi:hypothetical protein